MSPRTAPTPEPLLVPVAVLIVAMLGFQAGAALAKTLIPVVGAAGAVALRLGLATLMLLLVSRPWRMRPAVIASTISPGISGNSCAAGSSASASLPSEASAASSSVAPRRASAPPPWRLC